MSINTVPLQIWLIVYRRFPSSVIIILVLLIQQSCTYSKTTEMAGPIGHTEMPSPIDHKTTSIPEATAQIVHMLSITTETHNVVRRLEDFGFSVVVQGDVIYGITPEPPNGVPQGFRQIQIYIEFSEPFYVHSVRVVEGYTGV